MSYHRTYRSYRSSFSFQVSGFGCQVSGMTTLSIPDTWRDPWAFAEDLFLVCDPQRIVLVDGETDAKTLRQATSIAGANTIVPVMSP